METVFFVTCPVLKGCSTEGDTYEDAVQNIKEAIWLVLSVMKDGGESIPQYSDSGLPTVEVSI